ncbi:ABC transporter permease [Arsenicicoccus sp. oral taxon 190]|uniref:ABC transporter permease n=1 Tax=Arsenicicoccus sp. oral taxon 190 TaxID=1658671 RepID=UPI00067A382F|nr:ABC transporter permease [Arsenicicoccus sp. oral taxon 190]AKT51879.1 hypothetical protein ADJ73_12425 [Arsenicicoccus sp. oral taxon 190]
MARLTGLRSAVAVEWLKLRRSRVTLTASLALLTLVPGATALLHLGVGRGGSSPLAAKAAALVPVAGPDGLLASAAQLSGGLTVLGVGIVMAWCVGREFQDGTVTGLFAQPTRRRDVALAKCVVLTGWAVVVCAGVALIVGLLGLATGLSAGECGRVVGRLAALGVLLTAGAFPATLVATVARGVLAPVAVILGLVVATQLAVGLGAGAWVPWAAGVLWAGGAGPQAAATVSPLQLGAVLALAVASVAATVAAWDRLQLGRSR